MQTLLEEDVDACAPEPAPASRRWLFALILVGLSTLLILAHGCHGDEDHELFGGDTISTRLASGRH